MKNDISAHTLHNANTHNIEPAKMALSYSFRKAIIFFIHSSDEMNQLTQSRLCHCGLHQYLLWPID